MKSPTVPRTLLAFLVPFLFLSSTALAGLVDVDIVSDRGSPFRTFGIAPRGYYTTHRAYIEAVKGERYGIRVRNNSERRVGLVIAVDGRNVISGKKSHLKNGERMYILGPYETASYEGWRTDRDTVNRFYFTDAGDSYAAAWGDESAMGVVAVAVYREKAPPPPPPRVMERSRDSSMERRAAPSGEPPAPAEAGKAAPLAPSMEKRETAPGTGFGEETWSPSVRVAFAPEGKAAEKHFMKYEWRDTLCRKGIIDCRKPGNRFWDDDDDYAPYPPDRESWIRGRGGRRG